MRGLKVPAHEDLTKIPRRKVRACELEFECPKSACRSAGIWQRVDPEDAGAVPCSLPFHRQSDCPVSMTGILSRGLTELEIEDNMRLNLIGGEEFDAETCYTPGDKSLKFGIHPFIKICEFPLWTGGHYGQTKLEVSR